MNTAQDFLNSVAAQRGHKAVTPLDLAAMLERQKAALAEVFALAKGKRWIMSIPVQETDSDIVLAESLQDIARLVEEICRLHPTVALTEPAARDGEGEGR